MGKKKFQTTNQMLMLNVSSLPLMFFYYQGGSDDLFD
jgi:hypothetical protein